MVSAGSWAGLEGPEWVHSHVWCLGGECRTAKLTWDSWSESLRVTFPAWPHQGGQIPYVVAGSSREGIPRELDASWPGFSTLASVIPQHPFHHMYRSHFCYILLLTSESHCQLRSRGGKSGCTSWEGARQGLRVQEHVGPDMLAHPSLEKTFGRGLLLSFVFSLKKKSLHAAVPVFFFF